MLFGILDFDLPCSTCFFSEVIKAFSQCHILFKKKKSIPAIPPLDENELIEQFVRGSGPGGQAVNSGSSHLFPETNNAVSLMHKPTGIRVQAHTHRSREANRNQARRVLAERVFAFSLFISLALLSWWIIFSTKEIVRLKRCGNVKGRRNWPKQGNRRRVKLKNFKSSLINLNLK
ncbi:hypothetical protein VP01_1451g4 [Puccinia sorghi]|uniref:Prokaryotic-type class I peptide chain release factors domain-containing protein n=1 Tax=Puccinia sorghi TaxID=27349 RepID=A0A0L6VLV7_9BASI|nr:hypothetical protein VP01_1451g4 [Puccinia sorghi]